MNKKIKIKDALDALDKNGFPWTKGTFYSEGGSDYGASCAIGQMGRNLGIHPQNTNQMWKLHDVLNNAYYESVGQRSPSTSSIISINDSYGTFEDVKTEVHRIYDPIADKEIEVSID